MGSPCPGVGVGLGFVATIGIIYTLASKEWRVNSQTSSSAVAMNIKSYEGLWVRCTSSQAGQIICDNYDESKWLLPGELRGQRAFMCLAFIAALAGVIAGAVGLECIGMMKASKGKTWTGRSGGICMILAGLFTITAVSWYAAGVVRDFKVDEALDNTFVYQFGSALYVGWIAGGVALFSGCLLLFCNRMEEEDDGDDVRMKPYKYKSPQDTTPSYV